MIAKPMKTLELHQIIIQFFNNIKYTVLAESDVILEYSRRVPYVKYSLTTVMITHVWCVKWIKEEEK